MIGFRLQLKRLSDGRLIFTIPLAYRLLLFLIGLLILVSLMVAREQEAEGVFRRENAVALIICFLSFTGAVYHDRWIFDKSKGLAIHQNGLLALHTNRIYGFADFERVEVSPLGIGKRSRTDSGTRRSSFRASWRLSLLEKSGRVHTMERYRGSQLSRAESAAATISAYCGISLRVGEEA
jgi:hypothetical protein